MVDDLESVDQWRPRGLEIRGRAELHESGGGEIVGGFGEAWIRIHPHRIAAWGLDTGPFEGAKSPDVEPRGLTGSAAGAESEVRSEGSVAAPGPAVS